MGKEVEWGVIHGEGEIVCTCDACGDEYVLPFEYGQIDYREAQRAIEEEGWTSCQVNGEWHDFCCEKCRNDYIKKHG